MDLYFEIKKQRDKLEAPVDSMGSSCVGHAYPKDIKNFQILVFLLLSSQTKDEITYSAIESLNGTLGILTPENVLNSREEDVSKCLKKVGFHNKKLKFLYEISRKVKDKMPETFEELLKLPGVGKKMANLYLNHALGRNEGISVDTHVHRVSNRIGLVCTKDPEHTRRALESIFDRDEWPEVNRVFVGFGQMICKAIKPKCGECSVQDRCPYYNMVIASKNNKVNSKVNGSNTSS
ncbi:uncharacterized protein VICG_00638 [Vittaforma corneae ATCC 50505]|uniref:DNA-(apurinic or apyrimidinic site) lyase n=1 Tax=Vittaforma corneae (strain ATCC 50505) TaxID=993615 RepID=L2GNP5_VITCO|nr:uncharacterized protein VICG_00638 [Vittaforma corneae ATCC 50505]ELA42239.1 hypothetical protein VICG_00638 [Vittaforma corneae ATCC 50505]